MQPTVWHCRMMSDYQIGNKPGLAVKWFGQDWDPPTHIPPIRPMKNVDQLFRYMRGESLPRQTFPEAVYVFDGKRFGKMKELFAAGGFYMVNSNLARVLAQFDLGQGELVPLPFYQEDKVTRLPEDFYLWTFAAQKNAVLPEQSRNIKPFGIGVNIVEGLWSVRPDVEDDDIALSASVAARPPDVWCDTKLDASLFFSGALVAALRAAKIKTNFHLCRCRLTS